MRLFREPFGDIVGFVIAYVTAVSVLMIINSVLLSGREWPWEGYAVLWGIVFAPAAITVILSRAATAHCPRRLRRLYTAALAMILASQEVLYVVDAALTAAALTVVAVCVAVALTFRWAERLA